MRFFNKKGRQVFAGWLVDVSKYLATAIVLGTVFKDVAGWLTYVVGSVLVIIVLGIGIYISSKEEDKR
ncbi:MAG: hypothetical protein LBN37_06070 [Bacteroidales bacterium]|jgi:hypothetical protein|nr:hypothetical protein [Bacteroidales bacterium]